MFTVDVKQQQLQIWIIGGQGPTVLAVDAGGDCLDMFSLAYHTSFSLSLGDGSIFLELFNSVFYVTAIPYII